uniref:60 kDa stress protein/chaperonin homolog (Fragments) n=1 Tax=Sus scrofa TaxID=9823 RepID=Q9TS67_PIG
PVTTPEEIAQVATISISSVQSIVPALEIAN